MRLRAALVCVCLLGAQPAWQEQDVAALASVILAAPAPERAKLLDERGVKPNHALIDAMVVAAGRRLSAADFVGAGEIYEYTEALARSIGDDVSAGDSLLGLGQVYGRRADYERAQAALKESLAIGTRLGDQRLIAASLNNLGIVYRLQGDYEPARESYRRVLAIAEAAHNDDQIARARTNLGVIETYQGMYDAAVADLQGGLDIATRLKNAPLVLNGTLNLGNVYYYQGNCTLALDLYGHVLAEAERVRNVVSTLSALTNIAACERSLGRYDAALEHLRRVITLADERKMPAEVARARYGIAVVYRHERRWQEAMNELNASLEVRESIGDRLGIAETLVERGDVQLNLHEYDAALESVTRGAALADELDLPEVAFGARTIQGKTLIALGRSAEAETALRGAIRTIEATRLRVAGTAIDRARYLSESIEAYVVLAGLLAERHRDFDALVVAEQSHARSLGEVVAGHGAEDVLTVAERERQRALQKRLGSLNREIDALPPGAANAARMNELASARRAARLEEDRFTSSLYASHPELRLRLGAPTPLALDTLARRLDPSTAIVEYVEAPDATLILTATTGPKGPVVRARTVPVRSADLDARVAAFNDAIARRDLGVGAEAKALGALLLEPALAAGRERIIIVPDGALWTLPFHALRSAADRYVAEDHVVSYAPSIVALQLLADRRTGPASGPRTGFLGIADPDPAHPLPDARRQVESLAADPAWRGRALTGPAATEAAVRQAIGSARIVHVASHGVFEDASPLYSHLVLAPGDGTGTSNDGRLDAWELMRLRLRASLVVLAACETGRGGISSGEGVIGLSWAALAAGAPAAVVSLWRVDESATGAWMTAFYASWNAAGASRAAADASRALMASDRYRHPFYWAPFVVIGDPSGPSAPASRHSPASAAPRPTGSPRRP
jgi:CHAT domain-containing protein/lipopolysaccharide biosynthesis regulator YciM